MGRKKNLQLLHSGKISQAEYEKRLEQSRLDKERMRGAGKAGSKAAKAVRKLVVPEDAQDVAINNLSALKESMEMRYAAMLVNPKASICRMPDSYTRPTALVRSIEVFDLPVNITGSSADDGRFSFAVQPILGNLDDVSHYSNLVVNTGSGWPTDFSGPASWRTTLQGKDLRLNPFIGELTQPELGFLRLTSGGAVVTGSSSILGMNPTMQAFPVSYSLSYSYKTAGASAAAPATLQLPAGQYFIDVFYTGCTGPLTTNTSTGVINVLDNWFDPTLTGVGHFSCVFTAQNSVQSLALGATGVNMNTVANLAVSPVRTGLQPLPLDSGQVKEIRPVAMSVLVSYTGPLLTNGGNIAGAFCSGKVVDTNLVTVTDDGELGMLQLWENLSTVPGAYNGPIKDGVYLWWSPISNKDTEMVPVSASADLDLPVLVVSGQWAPGTSGPSQQNVLRVEVVKVFECTTTSLLLESVSHVGSQGVIDNVNQALAMQPHVMPNGKHGDWIRSFLGKAASFWKANRSWLVPMTQGLATVAGSFL